MSGITLSAAVRLSVSLLLLCLLINIAAIPVLATHIPNRAVDLYRRTCLPSIILVRVHEYALVCKLHIVRLSAKFYHSDFNLLIIELRLSRRKGFLVIVPHTGGGTKHAHSVLDVLLASRPCQKLRSSGIEL